jgi:hypothetical protein
LLRVIVEDACRPFYDQSLVVRLEEVRREWLEQVQDAFDDAVDDEVLEDIRSQAEVALEGLREKLEELGQIKDLQHEIEVPEPVLPEAHPPENGPKPLVSSDMALVDAITALRSRKDYTNGRAK